MPKFNFGGLVDAVAYGALDEILGMGRSDDGIAKPSRYEVTLFPPSGQQGSRGQSSNIFSKIMGEILGDGTVRATGLKCEAIELPGRTIDTTADTNIYGPERNIATGYTFADITFSAGSAAANATIAPPLGHGVDPVSELGGFFVGVNTQLSGSGGGDLTVWNDFRQISLIKNPTNYGTSTISTAATLQGMNYLDFASGVTVSNYVVDELIVGAGGAQAYVASIDSGNGYIYYTQNSKTGYASFVDGETVTGQTSTTAGALESSNAVKNPEVNRGSGEMLFLENRNPINRTTTQIEDIKVIIEF